MMVVGMSRDPLLTRLSGPSPGEPARSVLEQLVPVVDPVV